MRTGSLLMFSSVGLLLALSGCVTQPSLDSTQAPFHASTEVSGGTSQATSDVTQPTKEFTSSTTPGSVFNDDGVLKSDRRLLAFAAYNFENLRRDIAQGQGEYLGALASLMAVPAAGHDAFFRKAQDQYAAIYASGLAPRESYQRLVRELSVAE